MNAVKAFDLIYWCQIEAKDGENACAHRLGAKSTRSISVGFGSRRAKPEAPQRLLQQGVLFEAFRYRAQTCVAQDASLILIGGRAAGKTTIGLIASTFLRRPLIDADKLFEKMYNCSIAESVAKEGFPLFRDREEHMLRKLLEKYPQVSSTNLSEHIHHIEFVSQ